MHTDDHRRAIDFAETAKLCVDFKAARKRLVRRSVAAGTGNRNGDCLFNTDGAAAAMVSLQICFTDVARKADQMECAGAQ